MDELIILKYLNQTASKAEIVALEKWVAEKAANQEEFAQIEKLWKASEELTDYQVFDTGVAWNKIQGMIEEDEEMNQASKTPKQIPLYSQNTSKSTSNSPLFMRIAAGFLIFVMAGLLFYTVFSTDNRNVSLTDKVVTSEDNLLRVPLSDGSVVTLNQHSTLTYPSQFSDDTRKVILIGEAFFEVAENPKKPFVIETGETNVKVLGTTFNVNSRNVEHIEVTVASGKVQFLVKENEKKAVILQKNDRGIFENNEVNKFKNTDTNFLSWKTGILDFNDKSSADIIKTANRHFNTDIQFEKNSPILDCKLTYNIDNQPLETLLKDMELFFDVEVVSTDNGYLLKGGTCQ
ncbi:MAG: FecR family protein [Chitinophagales bacterium]